MFQMTLTGAKRKFIDKGPLPGGFSLREFSDRTSGARRGTSARVGTPPGLLLTAMVPQSEGAPAVGKSLVDKSADHWASELQSRIDAIVKPPK